MKAATTTKRIEGPNHAPNDRLVTRLFVLRLDRTKRALNRALARLRITVEHVIRRLKVFWILARPYRNRRRRFGLRLNLIAGLYNFELEHT